MQTVYSLLATTTTGKPIAYIAMTKEGENYNIGFRDEKQCFSDVGLSRALLWALEQGLSGCLKIESYQVV